MFQVEICARGCRRQTTLYLVVGRLVSSTGSLNFIDLIFDGAAGLPDLGLVLGVVYGQSRAVSVEWLP